MQEKADRKIEIHKAYQARRRMVYRSVSRVHREAIIYREREQAPAATAGAIFLQVTRPGGSVPFCRRRFETAPRETGAHCVSPLPHTPTPGILPAGEKKRDVFHQAEERREKNRPDDHWNRPWLLRHKNAALCVPNWDHRV